MLTLKDIREYISGIGIAADDCVYIGKCDNKQDKAIGVYSRESGGPPITPLGGYVNGSYEIKPISLLVHWNKCKDETERAAYALFERIRKEPQLIINDTLVQYLRLMVPEPQDVGTDDYGIYEYVIWVDCIYSKEANL